MKNICKVIILLQLNQQINLSWRPNSYPNSIYSQRFHLPEMEAYQPLIRFIHLNKRLMQSSYQFKLRNQLSHYMMLLIWFRMSNKNIPQRNTKRYHSWNQYKNLKIKTPISNKGPLHKTKTLVFLQTRPNKRMYFSRLSPRCMDHSLCHFAQCMDTLNNKNFCIFWILRITSTFPTSTLSRLDQQESSVTNLKQFQTYLYENSNIY